MGSSSRWQTVCRCTCWIVVEWPEYARRRCRLCFVASHRLTTITAEAGARSTSWEEKWESLAEFWELCQREWEREKTCSREMKHLWSSAGKTRSLQQQTATGSRTETRKCDAKHRSSEFGCFYQHTVCVVSAGENVGLNKCKVFQRHAREEEVKQRTEEKQTGKTSRTEALKDETDVRAAESKKSEPENVLKIKS